jgi:rubrerythrin
MKKEHLQSAIDAVRTAIITEIKGLELYQTAAERAADPDARRMFEMLADEERRHRAFLEHHYSALVSTGEWAASEPTPHEREDVEEFILDEGFRRSLRRGTFEMAVVALALDLESKAVQFYRDVATNALDEETRNVFRHLAEWEEGHHRQFLALEKELRDAYFSERGFAPM